MKVSFIALNRMVERQAAEDPTLRRGLSIENVRDRDYLLERLEVLLEEQGRIKELEELRARRNAAEASTRVVTTALRSKATLDFVKKGLPIDKLPRLSAKPQRRRESSSEPARGQITGRNEPCPCGSGKKYRKCCGR